MSTKIEVELQAVMGDDKAIANAAWTSTYKRERREAKWDSPVEVADLVRRVVTEGHSTPIESVVLRFWIRHPIYGDRQHMTHRIASHNGESARYRTMGGDSYSIPDDVCAILDKVQGGYGKRAKKLFDASFDNAYDLYANDWLPFMKKAEKDGVVTNGEYKRVREILRSILPTSLMVERVTTMNLVSFANYQRLRNSPHAQKEIRQVARLMLREVHRAGVAPTALAALQVRGWLIGHPNHDFEVAGDDE